MKKNILFINQNQFGYHITYYKYCENLVKDDYNITFCAGIMEGPGFPLTGSKFIIPPETVI